MTAASRLLSETIISCQSSLIENLSADVRPMDDSSLCECIDSASSSTLPLLVIEATSISSFPLTVTWPDENSDELSSIVAPSLFPERTKGFSLFQARYKVRRRANTRGISIYSLEVASMFSQKYKFDHCGFDETTLGNSRASMFYRHLDILEVQKISLKNI